MKKGITLLTIILSVLHSYAQENWNAVKVFELNTDDIYNFYIDTIGTEDGKVDFCFQTSDYKLIKTDAQGNIIDVTDSPYHYYTIFNGDTIIIDDGYVINVSKGDTIYLNKRYYCCRIAASSSGIYVYLQNPFRNGQPSYIVNCINRDTIHETRYFGGFNCNNDGVYIIERARGDLYFVDEKKSEKTHIKHCIEEPRGIAEFRGFLYVYSKNDKAVYRLEPSGETSVIPIIDKENIKEPVHYGFDGRKIKPSNPGIHIVKYPDGVIRKIVVL